MKTLLIWSGAVVPAYRSFFSELGKHMRLRVLGPRSWKHGSKTFAGLDGPIFEHGAEIFPVTFFPARSSRYVIPSLPLHLWMFRPRLLYIMDELDRISLSVNALVAKLCLPRVRIVSYSLQNLERPGYYKWHHRAALWINKRLVARVATASREAEAVLRSHGYAGPTRVIPLWGAETWFKPAGPNTVRTQRRLWQVPDDAIVLLYAGSLVEAKGLSLLAQVLPRFPRLRLATAGGGPLEVTLRERLGSQWIACGALEGEDLIRFYQSGDYIILPSRDTENWKEQIGRSLIEGVLCGCAALGSDSGHIPELTLWPEAGFAQGDAESLALLLGRLPLPRVAALREAQRRNVLERFSASAVARSTWLFLSAADGEAAATVAGTAAAAGAGGRA